ncbi:MAG: SprT family zinc-dependent metalloprotease [Thermodesulfobacteriota bacterium]
MKRCSGSRAATMAMRPVGTGKAAAAMGPGSGRETMASTTESRLQLLKGAIGEVRIRTSPRARHVRLNISAHAGLTVTVPRGFDLRALPDILEKKRSWIVTHLGRLAGMPGAAGREPLAAPPEAIELPALGESWDVLYLPSRTRRIGVMEQPGRLTVYGAVADHAACRAVLQKWLRRRAREALVPLLEGLARQEGFTFNDVLIRGQKTRWASCSSGGTISLSYKLLFLDPRSVRCILLHELCHRVHMNHSDRFWALLSGFEPECRVLRRRMREEAKRVPAWVE